MIIFTIIIVIAFMIRCTSPIGFVILVLYKLYKERNLVSFIISGFMIAIPTVILFIAFDTYYYKKLTFVPYNFLYQNIILKKSEDFGVSPANFYFKEALPYSFNYLTPLLFVTICYYGY
jgi:hypothetical protein